MNKSIERQIDEIERLARNAATVHHAACKARHMLNYEPELTWQQEDALSQLLHFCESWARQDTRALEEVHGVFAPED